MVSYKAIYVIVLREFKRFFRQKGRLVVTIARPLIWLLIVGAGFSKLVDPEGGSSYLRFIMPGIVGMTILFSSVFSTISVVWDREFGFLREMLVAPVSRLTIVLGKLFAGSALSLFQGAMLLLVAPFLGIELTVMKYLQMLCLMTIVSLSITAFGLVIASLLKSLEGFNVIMNFVVLPMFFLSGALYPVNVLPPFLIKLTYINPLAYGVDSFKHILLPGNGTLVAEFPLYVDLIFVTVFMIIMTVIAAVSFSRR